MHVKKINTDKARANRVSTRMVYVKVVLNHMINQFNSAALHPLDSCSKCPCEDIYDVIRIAPVTEHASYRTHIGMIAERAQGSDLCRYSKH